MAKKGRAKRWAGLAAVVLLGGYLAAGTESEARSPKRAAKPRLIVLLVVDQMRGDYLERFRARFGPDGFERLEREGARFTSCHYNFAVTVTAPGYATLATGTTPDRHGIVDNSWYDRDRQRVVQSIFDENFPLVTEGLASGASGQARIGQAARASSSRPRDRCRRGATEETVLPAGQAGASPCSLMAPTLGDALKRATRGRARRGGQANVYGVGWKDRAAILTAGKAADGAYWFDTPSGRFVTSSYYADGLPAWLAEFNRTRVDAYGGRRWEVPAGNVLVELAEPSKGPGAYYAGLSYTPYANELLVELAERLVVEENLGADEVPDLLGLALSANDYVGHHHGPYSKAVEEITVETDRQLARFLRFLDQRVGAGKYWVVVSSDHGVAPTLAQARAHGIAAKNVSRATLLDAGLAALERRWGKDEWGTAWAGDAVFNREVLARHGIGVEEAARVAGDALMQVEGVIGYATGRKFVGPPEFAAAFARSYYPGRSPDVKILLEPFALVEGDDGETTHGTPHSYDTHVPLILLGLAFRAGVYAERVSPADVAPTLAAALGLRALEATGQVLREALQ